MTARLDATVAAFLAWASRTDGSEYATWEIDRRAAAALAARLEAAETALREASVPIGRITSSEPLNAQEYRQLAMEAHRIIRAALAAGRGETRMSGPWNLIERQRTAGRERADLPCTYCGRPCWENLYGHFGCINTDCCAFGEMRPCPARSGEHG